VGPGVTREQLVIQYEQSNRFFKAYGCPTLDLPPASDGCSLAGGESRCPPPHPGFAIIQNLIADEDLLDNNGQSVILIAPSFRNGHTWKWKCGEECTGIVCRPKLCGGFSALLNNGVTDKGYFLQVGLYFTNRDDPVNPLLKGGSSGNRVG
jgi:hypothetical protein